MKGVQECLGFFFVDACLTREFLDSHAVNQAEIDCLGKLSLSFGDLVNVDIEERGRSTGVDVFAALVGAAQHGFM